MRGSTTSTIFRIQLQRSAKREEEGQAALALALAQHAESQRETRHAQIDGEAPLTAMHCRPSAQVILQCSSGESDESPVSQPEGTFEEARDALLEKLHEMVDEGKLTWVMR